MPYLVGPKGQIVVAKELRDRLGVKPGWIALQRLAGDHIEVYFVPPEHEASLKGSLARHIRARLPRALGRRARASLEAGGPARH